jgi:hypothetical protein
MKKQLKRLAGFLADLRNNLLSPALPRPAYQRVVVRASQPRVIRRSRRGQAGQI